MTGLVAGLAFFGGVCALYMVVATVRNVAAQFRRKSPAQVYREARDGQLGTTVPDDEHRAFPDDVDDAPERPHLTIVR